MLFFARLITIKAKGAIAYEKEMDGLYDYVLKPEYAELFTEDEKKMCRDRLLQFGYEIN